MLYSTGAANRNIWECCACAASIPQEEVILWPSTPERLYCQPCFKEFAADANEEPKPAPENRRKEAVMATRKKRGR